RTQDCLVLTRPCSLFRSPSSSCRFFPFRRGLLGCFFHRFLGRLLLHLLCRLFPGLLVCRLLLGLLCRFFRGPFGVALLLGALLLASRFLGVRLPRLLGGGLLGGRLLGARLLGSRLLGARLLGIRCRGIDRRPIDVLGGGHAGRQGE